MSNAGVSDMLPPKEFLHQYLAKQIASTPWLFPYYCWATAYGVWWLHWCAMVELADLLEKEKKP